MICQTAQQQLLASTQPLRPSASELAEHLQSCPDCQRLVRRLARLERSVSHIPSPPAGPSKKAFLRRFRESAVPEPVSPRRLAWRPLLPKLGFAAAVAAVLLIGVLAIRNQPRPVTPGQPAADPMLARLLQRHLDLANASTSIDRLRTLADLADDLSNESRQLARVANPDDLTLLARLYGDVVTEGLILQARTIPDPESRRRALHDVQLRERLLKASMEADRLADEVPISAATALKAIAETAREATRQLNELGAGGRS